MRKIYRRISIFLLLLLWALLTMAFVTNEEMWSYVYQIALIIATLAGGGGTVWAVNRLKKMLKLSGYGALALTAVIAVVVAAATLVVDGVIGAGMITAETFGVVFLAVFTEAKIIYDAAK